MEHEELLRRFERILLEKAVPLGMVSASDAPRLWERHIMDSLAAVDAFEPGDRHAVDLGSGAGLPGIVLAVALPAVRFVLAETRTKRVGFLEYAAETLGLGNVSIAHGRAEQLPPASFDVATARAFAPAPRAWRIAQPLLRPAGRLVYFAGPGATEDLGERGPRRLREVPVLASDRRLVIMSGT